MISRRLRSALLACLVAQSFAGPTLAAESLGPENALPQTEKIAPKERSTAGKRASLRQNTATASITHLNDAPPLPEAFFAGNRMARLEHWQEARQLYSDALSEDGSHPDILFNLAVSLDHLEQPRAAANHYRQAVAASARRPAGFAPETATRRIERLESPEIRP